MPSNLSLFIELPKSAITWIAWLVILISLFSIGFLIRNSEIKVTRTRLMWLAGLSILILFTSTVLAVKIDFEVIPGQTLTVMLLPLVTFPWLLAVGVTGVISSLALALAAGLLTASVHTHTLFTPLFFVCLALCFNLLVGTRKYAPNSDPAHSAFVSSLWTALIGLGLLFGFTLLSNTGSFVERLIAGWTSFLLESLRFIPGLILGGLLCQLLSRFLPAQWASASFQKSRVSRQPIHQATGLVKALTQGNYYQPIKGYRKVGKSGALLQALEDLRASLEIQNQANTKLLGLEQVNLSDKSFEELLALILRAALRNEGSAARLILFGKQLSQSQYEMRMRLGHGKKCTVYAFLDEMVIGQLKETSRLVLSDLKIDSMFNIKQGIPGPKAIIAYSLEQGKNKLGALWVGFDQNHWFTEEDLVYYETLVQRASAAIHQADSSMKALSERKQLMDLLDSLPDPLLYLAGDGRLLFANQAAKNIKAWALPLTKGKALKDILSDRELVAWIENLSDLPKSKTISLSEGHEYVVSLDSVRNENKQEGFLCLFKDTSQVRKINAQKTEFVTNVSHDLRTPLTLMKGYITMLQNIGNLSDQQQMYVQRIFTGIEGMNRLVNNVLNLERMDSGDALQLKDGALKDIIQSAVQSLEMPAQQKKVYLDVDYGGMENLQIRADRILLQQALFNLLDNAVKFSSMGGKVFISVSKPVAGIRIAVKDEGVGIAPLDQPRVFDRYYHAEAGSERSQTGYGLGLAIVRSIVEKHGGKVGLTSQLGRGSTFYVDLPEAAVIKWG
jgi:signal transduction histidine kinase